eukprot:GILK01006206.1.p1 GENE.GILK01006206.1~~GILK01006206.1.p1  ORF type:complete len:212 (-),score=25.51 GILK01006206.1:161-796(-)
MAASIGELLPRGMNLKLEAQHLLEQLESGANTSVNLQQTLSMKVNELTRIVGQLEQLVQLESGAKRDTWRRRVEALAADNASLRASLDKHLGLIYRHKREEEDRQRLFERRSQDGTAVSAYLREHNSLKEQNNLIDGIFETGRSVLTSLSSQGATLKGAQRRVLDIANVLGLSNSLMRVIERRHSVDKWLVLGGMIVTMLVFWLTYQFVKG